MKNNVFKRFISLLVVITIIIFPASNAFANESETIVIISPEAVNIPDYVIEQIIEENPDAGVINIYEYGDIINTNENSKQNIITNPLDEVINNKSDIPISPTSDTIIFIRNIVTNFTVIYSEREAKDEFKFSVAKGEQVTLTYTISGELKGGFTGIPINASDLGVSITLKGEYSKGTRYSGPEESSPYNSREFRMKFYEQVGIYNQTAERVTWKAGYPEQVEHISESGTYYKPTRYVSYSIDRKI